MFIKLRQEPLSASLNNTLNSKKESMMAAPCRASPPAKLIDAIAGVLRGDLDRKFKVDRKYEHQKRECQTVNEPFIVI